MYNEDLKKRYIDKKESEVVLAPNFLKNTFTKTEPFEEKLNKDVSSWTRKEIDFTNNNKSSSYKFIIFLSSKKRSDEMV